MMRTDEEKIAAMHKRAAELKTEKHNRDTLLLSAVSVVACFAFVIVFAVGMSGINTQISITNTMGMSASLFNGDGALGFAAVGIVAFLLGISVSIFCFRLKKWQEKKDAKHSEEAL